MAVVENTIISGGGGDYSTIAAWEADTDLNAGADIWKGVISDNAEYDETVTINVDGTSVDSHVWLTVAEANRHAGIWDTGKARLAYSGSGFAAIEVAADWARVDHLQIYRTGSTGIGDRAITMNGPDDAVMSRMVLWTDDASGTTRGIYALNGPYSFSLDHIIAYGWQGSGLDLDFISTGDDAQINIDYCAFGLSGDHGIRVDVSSDVESVITAHNSWSAGNTNDITADVVGASNQLTFAGSNNAFDSVNEVGAGTASFDWTSNETPTDGVTTTPPASAGVYITEDAIATFDATPIDDANNVLIGNGVDRQGSEPDPRQDFSTDIAGNARPTTNVDIGPFQISAGGGGSGGGASGAPGFRVGLPSLSIDN